MVIMRVIKMCKVHVLLKKTMNMGVIRDMLDVSFPLILPTLFPSTTPIQPVAHTRLKNQKIMRNM